MSFGMSFTQGFFLAITKEVRLLLASPGRLIAAVVFAVILALIYQRSFPAALALKEDTVYGLLLASLIFISAIIPLWQQQMEKEKGALRVVLCSKVDLTALYMARVLGLWIALLIVLVIMLPVYFLLLLGRPPGFLLALLPLGLAALAMAAAATILISIAGENKMKNILLPLLQLPLMVPVMIVALHFLSLPSPVWSDRVLAGIPALTYLAAGTLFYGYALLEVQD
ncbi:MAG: heme exporter protein CcmB [Spirochaetales bacterium]|nr:heme exporter protein CcmB [Spirochaetales bacterium]